MHRHAFHAQGRASTPPPTTSAPPAVLSFLYAVHSPLTAARVCPTSRGLTGRAVACATREHPPATSSPAYKRALRRSPPRHTSPPATSLASRASHRHRKYRHRRLPPATAEPPPQAAPAEVRKGIEFPRAPLRLAPIPSCRHGLTRRRAPPPPPAAPPLLPSILNRGGGKRRAVMPITPSLPSFFQSRLPPLFHFP